MKLSIMLAGIRPQNWLKLYNSINESFHDLWEIVIVSPYELPPELMDKTNVKWVQDFGCVTRCYQIALVNSIGKYVVVAADDGEFLPNALDIAIASLESTPNSVIVGTYQEGDNFSPDMVNQGYYYPKRHDATNVEYFPKDCMMLMEGIMPRDVMFEVGGYECKFETYPMAAIDLSARLYNKGMNFIFQKEILFKCSHLPGMEGDHAPIHMAQTTKDVPLFRMIYSNPKSAERINIPLNNWELSPKRWVRRFGV